jgi:hypothetical protein
MGYRFVDVDAFDGGADLAGIRERTRGGLARGPGGVHAAVHDHRVLTAELDDGLLELSACCL